MPRKKKADQVDTGGPETRRIDQKEVSVPQVFRETSADIIAPGPLACPRYNTGGVGGIKGPMETGKSLVLMALAKYQIEVKGFASNRVFGNFRFRIPGYHYLTNTELKKVLRRAYGKKSKEVGEFTGCIFLIMEADSLYSHKDSIDKDGETDLWHLSQSMRFNNYVLYEYHEGLGVLKFLRDKTELIYKPEYKRKADRIDVLLHNGHHMNNWAFPIHNVSKLHPLYDRFAAIV